MVSSYGEAGLPQLADGLNVLLDTLAPAKVRIVLLAPLRLEDLGRPLPDPAAENKNIRLYTDALRGVAEKRGLTFADMNAFLGDGPGAAPLTDDEMHLTGAGYWRSAFALEQCWACRSGAGATRWTPASPAFAFP